MHAPSRNLRIFKSLRPNCFIGLPPDFKCEKNKRLADLLERHKKDKLTFDLPKAKLVILLCNFKALKCQHFKHQNYIVMQVTFHVMKTYYIFQKHPFKKWQCSYLRRPSSPSECIFLQAVDFANKINVCLFACIRKQSLPDVPSEAKLTNQFVCVKIWVKAHKTSLYLYNIRLEKFHIFNSKSSFWSRCLQKIIITNCFIKASESLANLTNLAE